MANIERVTANRWRVCWQDATGKRMSSKRFKTKKDALYCKERVELGLAALKPQSGITVIPLPELIERYLASRVKEDRAKPGYVLKTRATLLHLIEERGWKSSAAITVESAGTLKLGEYRLFKALVRYGAQIGQPLDQRVLLMSAPKRVRKPKSALLTPEQVAMLIDEAADWCPANGALAHMLSTYGHRPESAVQLRVGSVDLEGGTLTLEVKGGDVVRHPLLESTLRLLRPLCVGRGAEEFLFLNHRGKPWGTGQALASWWYHYVGEEKHEDAPGIYELKRYAITSMLDRGLSLDTIASITGHRTPAILLTYARTNADKQARAIAALAQNPPNVPLISQPKSLAGL
jgi:integrase